MRIQTLLLVALIATSAINAQATNAINAKARIANETDMSTASGNIFESHDLCVKRHKKDLADLMAASKLLAKGPKTAETTKKINSIAARIVWFKKSMADCVDKAKFCAPVKPIPKPCVATKHKCLEMHSGKCQERMMKCSTGYTMEFCKCKPVCKLPAKWDVKTSKCAVPPPICGLGKVLVGEVCLNVDVEPITCKKPCKTVGTSCECPKRCKEGYTLNKKTKECEKETGGHCPQDQLLNKDGVCEKPKDCPPSYVNKGNGCKKIPEVVPCKAGQRRKDGQCVDIKVCPKGFTFHKSLDYCTKKCE